MLASSATREVVKPSAPSSWAGQFVAKCEWMNANNTSYFGGMTNQPLNSNAGGVRAERVTITRVINPCVLIDIDGRSVLTDPYFEDHWFLPMNEPIGMRPDELPELAAILGGHRVFDHWQPQSLRTYLHRATTPVFVAGKGMARKARSAGFDRVEVLGWHERRDLGGDLTVECVPGERSFSITTNSYVLTTPNTTIYIGTEARHLEPITTFATNRQVDIAVLPIDGLRVAGRRLVMNASEALQAAQILGAKTLVPIHYSQRSIPGIVVCTSGIDELIHLAQQVPSIRVLHAVAGSPIPVR
jgi:L-ascorbate metabolism protein UlaG (beta-lactamase superfamily)